MTAKFPRKACSQRRRALDPSAASRSLRCAGHDVLGSYEEMLTEATTKMVVVVDVAAAVAAAAAANDEATA